MSGGPFGIDAEQWSTGTSERTVLVVVHSVTAATRLTDVLPLFNGDRRLQIVFTQGPSSFPRGVTEFVRNLGGVMTSWHDATSHRFDLAVATSHGRLERLHAPVLTMPHGVVEGLPDAVGGSGPPGARGVWGLEPQQLVHHGRVVPATIVLPNHRQLQVLRRTCPEAVPAAVVAGDPCYDRLLLSLPFRDRYRQALRMAEGQKLIVVSSTWGPRSLLGKHRDLLPRLMAALPHDEYRVAAILHPNVWTWHSSLQITTWYADCVERGLMLIPPEEGWRAALIAADCVIGDHGSVTAYGAAIGAPTVFGAYASTNVHPRSPFAALARRSAHLLLDEPISPQVDAAIAAGARLEKRRIARHLTSVPRRSAVLIRQAMYGLMDLPEPPGEPTLAPVPAPLILCPHASGR
jgi:hypothetical protein